MSLAQKLEPLFGAILSLEIAAALALVAVPNYIDYRNVSANLKKIENRDEVNTAIMFADLILADPIKFYSIFDVGARMAARNYLEESRTYLKDFVTRLTEDQIKYVPRMSLEKKGFDSNVK